MRWVSDRYFDSNLTTEYRGASYYDGGLSNFLPLPPSVKAGVRVCCFPSKQINSVYSIQISPDSFAQCPYTMREVCHSPFSKHIGTPHVHLAGDVMARLCTNNHLHACLCQSYVQIALE